MRPTITHVVPVCNGARHLRAALDSLRGELAPGDEILVSDDGSTDDSAAIAAAWGAPVRVLRGPNGGPAAARNRALAEARGAWVCLLDADDLALPDRVARLGARLLAADRPDLVYGAQRRFCSEEEIAPGAAAPAEIDDPPAPRCGSLLTWRETFARIGGFDESLRGSEVVEWLARGQAAGLRYAAVPAVVLRRRRHAANFSRHEDYRGQMIEAVRRLMQRRREGGA